jgi:aurora kinase
MFLDHPNVTKTYGFFHDKSYFYILMEYMEEGSLYRIIKMNKKLTEEETKAKLF